MKMNKNNCHAISVVILFKIGLDNFNLICAQIRPKKEFTILIKLTFNQVLNVFIYYSSSLKLAQILRNKKFPNL